MNRPAFRSPDQCPRGHSALLRWHRLCTALTLTLLLAGCAKPPPPAIRIGISSFPAYELLYLAQEQGYFREEGVDVRIVEFASLSNTRVALENGQIDGAATTLVDLVLASGRKRTTARVIWVLDASNGADKIVARAPVGSMKDLKGRKIAVEVDSLGLIILQRALERNSLALADVTLVDGDQPAGAAALRAGRVDALVTYAPFADKLLRDGRMRSVFDSSAIPHEVIDVLALKEEIIAQRPHDVDRIRKAIQRALDYLRDHEDLALQIMARREQASEREMRRALKEGLVLVEHNAQHAYLRPGGLLESSMAIAVNVLREARRLEEVPSLAKLLPVPTAPGRGELH